MGKTKTTTKKHRTKKTMMKRMLSLLLTLAMVVTILPMENLRLQAAVVVPQEPGIMINEFHLTDSNWQTDPDTGNITEVDRDPSVYLTWTATGLTAPASGSWYDAELYVSPNNLSQVKNSLKNLASMNNWPADSPKRTHISGLGSNYWQTSISRRQIQTSEGSYTGMLHGNFLNTLNEAIQIGDRCTWQLVIYKRTMIDEDNVESEEILATDMAETTVDWAMGLPYMNEKHMEIAYQWEGEDALTPTSQVSYEAEAYVWPQDGIQDPYDFSYGWVNTLRWSEEPDFNVLMSHGAWSDCMLEKNGNSAWFCNDGTFAEGESLTPEPGATYTTGLIIHKIDRSSGSTKVTEYRRSPAVEFTVSEGTDPGSGMGPGENENSGSSSGDTAITTTVGDTVTEYKNCPVNLTFTGSAGKGGTLAWSCTTTDQYNTSGKNMGLPLGLEFTSNGSSAAITGTPTLNTRAPMEVTVTLTETAGGVETKTTKVFTLNVEVKKPMIKSSKKIAAQTGTPFSVTLEGVAGYEEDTLSWKLDSGNSLPTGVTFDEAKGILSGTVTEAGTYTFDIALLETTPADVVQSSVTETFTLTVATATHSDAAPKITKTSYNAGTHTLTVDFTTEDTASGYFEVYMITAQKPEYNPADTTPSTITKPGVSGEWYVLAWDSMDYGQEGVTFNRATGKGRLVTPLRLSQGIENYPAIGDVVYIVMQTEGIPGVDSAYSKNAYLKVPLPDPEDIYVSLGTLQEDEREFNVNIDPDNPVLKTFTGGKWAVATVRMTKDENMIYHVAPMKEDLSKVASGTSGYATYAEDKYGRHNWQWCNYKGEVLNPDNPWIGYNSASIDASMGTIPVSVYQFPGTATTPEEEMKGFYNGEDLIIGIQAISKENPEICSNLVTVRVPLEEESFYKTFRPSSLDDPIEPEEPDPPTPPTPVVTQPSLGTTAKTINTTSIADFAISKNDGSFTFDSIQCGEDTLVNGTDYTAAKGSVTIKQAWLASLAPGTYTITFHYTGTAGENNTAPIDPSFTLTIVQMCSPALTVKGNDGTVLTEGTDYAVIWRKNGRITTDLNVTKQTTLSYTVTPKDTLKVGGVQYYKEVTGEVTLNEAEQPVNVKLAEQGTVTILPKTGGEMLSGSYTVTWYDVNNRKLRSETFSNNTNGVTSPMVDAGMYGLKYEIKMNGANAEEYNDVTKTAVEVKFANTTVDVNINQKNNITLNVTGTKRSGEAVTKQDYTVIWYTSDDDGQTFQKIGKAGAELKNINFELGTKLYYEILPLDYSGNGKTVHNWLEFHVLPVNAERYVTVTESKHTEDAAPLVPVKQVTLTGTVTNMEGVGSTNLEISASQTPWDGCSIQPSTWWYHNQLDQYTFSVTGNQYSATVYDFDTNVKIKDKSENFDTAYRFVKGGDTMKAEDVTMSSALLPDSIGIRVNRMTPEFDTGWHDNGNGEEIYGGYGFVREYDASSYEEAAYFTFELFNVTQNKAVPKEDYTVQYNGAVQEVQFHREKIEGDGEHPGSGSVKMGDKLRLTMTVPEENRENIHADLTGPFTSEVTVRKYWNENDYRTGTYRFAFDYNAWGKIGLETEYDAYYWETYGLYDEEGNLSLSGTKACWWNAASIEAAAGTYTLCIWRNTQWISTAPATLAELKKLLKEGEYQERTVTAQVGKVTIPSPSLGKCVPLDNRSLFTDDSGFLQEMTTASGGEETQFRLSYQVNDAIRQANPKGLYAIRVNLSSKTPSCILRKQEDHDWMTGKNEKYDRYINLYADGELDTDNTVRLLYYSYNGLSANPNGFVVYTDKPEGTIFFSMIGDMFSTGTFTFNADGWLCGEQDEYGGWKESYNSKLQGSIGSTVYNVVPSSNCSLYFASDYLRMPDNGAEERNDYENGIWVYSLPYKTVKLYLDDVEIASGRSDSNGMTMFSVKMDESLKLKFEAGWSRTGRHTLYAETIVKEAEGGKPAETTRSQTYERECLAKTGDIRPAQLTGLKIQCTGSHGTFPIKDMMRYKGTTNTDRRNPNIIYSSYTVQSGAGTGYNFVATVENADWVDGDLTLWLTANTLETYRIPLKRVEGTNEYKGGIAQDNLIFGMWEVTISSKKPEKTGEAADAGTLESVGKSADDITLLDVVDEAETMVVNPATGEEMTLAAYDKWFEDTYLKHPDGTEKTEEELTAMINETNAAELENCENFFNSMAKITGTELPEGMVFDGSDESLAKMRTYLGINVIYPLAIQEDDDEDTKDIKSQLAQWEDWEGTVTTMLDGSERHKFLKLLVETSQKDQKPHNYSLEITVYTKNAAGIPDFAVVDVIDCGVSEVEDASIVDQGVDLYEYMSGLADELEENGLTPQEGPNEENISPQFAPLYTAAKDLDAKFGNNDHGNWSAKVQSFTEIAAFEPQTISKVEQLNNAMKQNTKNMNNGNNTNLQNQWWYQRGDQLRQQNANNQDAGAKEGSALTILASNLKDMIETGQKTGKLNDAEIKELKQMQKKVKAIQDTLSVNTAYTIGKSEYEVAKEIKDSIDFMKNGAKAASEGAKALGEYMKDTAKDVAVDYGKESLYESISKDNSYLYKANPAYWGLKAGAKIHEWLTGEEGVADQVEDGFAEAEADLKKLAVDPERRIKEVFDDLNAEKLRQAEEDINNIVDTLNNKYGLNKVRTRRTTSRNTNYGRAKAHIDPEGIVYEAVLSNPVEGATATVYEKTTAHPEGEEWDAATCGQENPQVTGADGWYQWFVPEGEWQVRVTAPEGSGLSDNTSADHKNANKDDGSAKGWLPVMPVQLGINIPLTSTASPDVKKCDIYPGYANVEFGLYMDVTGLNSSNITVKDEQGNLIPCTITLPDEDKDPLDETKHYAKNVRLTPKDGKGFDKDKTYQIAVKKGLDAYNEKALEADFDSGLIAVAGAVVAFTVSFDTDGGSRVDAQTIYDGDSAVRPADPAKKGYRFAGWQLDGVDYDFSRPVTADITLKAVWKENGSTGENPGGNTDKPSVTPAPKPTVVTKAANTLTVKAKTVKVKYKALQKKNQKIKVKKAMSVSKAQGKVTYKLIGVSKSKFKKYFKVNAKTGQITVRKKLKKGTYKLKIAVTAAGNGSYNALTKTVTVKVKVK